MSEELPALANLLRHPQGRHGAFAAAKYSTAAGFVERPFPAMTDPLRQQHGAQGWFQAVWGKAHKKSRNTDADQARRAKIADAKRGEKRPQSVVDALRKTNLGNDLSAETRAKLSKAHRQRGTMPLVCRGMPTKMLCC